MRKAFRLTVCIWLAFLCSMTALVAVCLHYPLPRIYGVNFDALGLLMSSLICFVSAIVHQFSVRYLAGDRYYTRYFLKLTAITVTLVTVALADHLLLFVLAWVLSNLLLVSLMAHKSDWLSAKNSAALTLKMLMWGSVFLLGACCLLHEETGSWLLSQMDLLAGHNPSQIVWFAMLFIIITAMLQSAQWPFQSWLLSSLNSPTPVSALMHAGLVNGGGFLLARFAIVVTHHKYGLNALFLFGAISALLGTLWKLVTPDVKRVLACSTFAQMGFMMMQCGLGLFSAAVAHLLWHGLFKAYLFLSAGSTVKGMEVEKPSPVVTYVPFFCACVCGLLGAAGFAWASEKTWQVFDTQSVLIGFAFIAAAQLAMVLLPRGVNYSRGLLVSLLVLMLGIGYGSTIRLIELMFPSYTTVLGEINALHVAVFSVFLLLWFALNLQVIARIQHSNFWATCYMRALNASQPQLNTLTPRRNDYQY